jgi:hypothetical protein
MSLLTLKSPDEERKSQHQQDNHGEATNADVVSVSSVSRFAANLPKAQNSSTHFLGFE